MNKRRLLLFIGLIFIVFSSVNVFGLIVNETSNITLPYGGIAPALLHEGEKIWVKQNVTLLYINVYNYSESVVHPHFYVIYNSSGVEVKSGNVTDIINFGLIENNYYYIIIHNTGVSDYYRFYNSNTSWSYPLNGTFIDFVNGSYNPITEYSIYFWEIGSLTLSNSTSFNITTFNLWNGSSINNFSVNISNNWCYQETANISTSCGGLGNGSYSFDNDATYGYFYMNYSKPLNVDNQSLWQVKSVSTIFLNYSIPSSCWDYDNSKISLRWMSGRFVGVGSCYNGSDWVTVIPDTANGCGDTGIDSRLLAYDGDYSTRTYYNELVSGWVPSDFGSSCPGAIYEEGIYWHSGDYYSSDFSSNNSGLVITDIQIDDNRLFDFIISSPDYFDYVISDYGVSSNLNASLFQSIINLSSCQEKITSNVLVCVNQSVIYPNVGVYNFSNNVSGYFGIVKNISINALDNYTLLFDGFYSSNVSLFPIFLYGNGSSNCNFTISNSTYSFSEVINGTPNASIGLINGTYQAIASCVGYAQSYSNFSVNSSFYNVSFNMYTNNSILFNIYDRESLLHFNNSASITMIGGTYYYYLSTINGTYYKDGLQPDTYKIIFDTNVSGYTPLIYYQTIYGGDHYDINAYFQNNLQTVTFAIKDDDSGDALSVVSLIIRQNINGTITTIASCVSDFAGNCIFYLDQYTEYTFLATLSGYDNYTGSVTPISTSYTVYMIKTTSYTSDVDFANILIYYSPKSFKNGGNYNISFTFTDVTDTLSYYGFNASFNGLTVTDSGVDSGGETLMKNLSINTSSIYDYVLITYWYKKVDGVRHEFTDRYVVYNAGGLTWANNKEESWGLGDFERNLIASCIIMVFAGAGAMFVGGAGIGLLALVGLFFVVKIGLLSGAVVWLSAFILIIITAWRASQ